MKAPATGQMHCQSLFLTNNGAYWRTLRSGSHRAHVQKINRGGKSSCLCYRTWLQLLVKAVCVSEKMLHKLANARFTQESTWWVCYCQPLVHVCQCGTCITGIKQTNKQTNNLFIFYSCMGKACCHSSFQIKGCFILQFQYKRSARRQESKTKSTFRNAVIEFFIFYIVKTCSSTTIQTQATVRFCQ